MMWLVCLFLSPPDFLFFWGAVFLITTTLVALLKKENKELTPTKEETKGITDTYRLLFSIIKMPAVLTFCLLILTAKVSKCIHELLDADVIGVWKVAEAL